MLKPSPHRYECPSCKGTEPSNFFADGFPLCNNCLKIWMTFHVPTMKVTGSNVGIRQHD